MKKKARPSKTSDADARILADAIKLGCCISHRSEEIVDAALSHIEEEGVSDTIAGGLMGTLHALVAQKGLCVCIRKVTHKNAVVMVLRDRWHKLKPGELELHGD